MKHLGCFLNGEWIKVEDAKISPLSHTLHYGTGVFEGVRSYNGKIFKLEDHTRRLFRSAKLMGIEIPYSEAQINEWQKEVIHRNGLQDAYLRPLIFLGDGTMSLDLYHHAVQVLIAAWPWPALHTNPNGIALKTVSFHKLAPNSTVIKAKAIAHYLNSALAVREAKAAGADEALVLDQKGYVCEGSAQNLFFAKNGRLFTPTLSTALDGITRATVIDLARENGLSITEGDFRLEELREADEIFLTGTATEIIGVRLLDGQAIGKGHYPITKTLQAAYQALVRA